MRWPGTFTGSEAPLDDLVAQTRSMIGYWLASPCATPAFTHPAKFVGPGYAPAEAERLADRHGWTVALYGDHRRRVVACPGPQRIVEQDSITSLLDAARW